jgi:hypothetical protein
VSQKRSYIEHISLLNDQIVLESYYDKTLPSIYRNAT